MEAVQQQKYLPLDDPRQQCASALRRWVNAGPGAILADPAEWHYRSQTYAGFEHEILEGGFKFNAGEAGICELRFTFALTSPKLDGDGDVVLSYVVHTSPGNEAFLNLSDFFAPHTAIGETWSKSHSDRSLSHMFGWRLGDSCFILRDLTLEDTEA